MSWISKLLGLDKHPSILSAINEVGHTVGTIALETIPNTDLKGRVGGIIDQVTAKFVDAVPGIPVSEGGMAKVYLADEMKNALFAEMDRYEPVPATTLSLPEAPPEEQSALEDKASVQPEDNAAAEAAKKSALGFGAFAHTLET